MISIDFDTNEKGKLYILFIKERKKTVDYIFSAIRDVLFEDKDVQFFVSICGLGVTIESFINQINSKEYILIDKYKDKFIYRSMAKAYIKVSDRNDIDIFEKYIGEFSEGDMTLAVLNTSIKYSIYDLVNSKDSLCSLLSQAKLRIDIIDDAESFEITSQSTENLLRICTAVSRATLLM